MPLDLATQNTFNPAPITSAERHGSFFCYSVHDSEIELHYSSKKGLTNFTLPKAVATRVAFDLKSEERASTGSYAEYNSSDVN